MESKRQLFDIPFTRGETIAALTYHATLPLLWWWSPTGIMGDVAFYYILFLGIFFVSHFTSSFARYSLGLCVSLSVAFVLIFWLLVETKPNIPRLAIVTLLIYLLLPLFWTIVGHILPSAVQTKRKHDSKRRETVSREEGDKTDWK